jgi:hypothetical protein
VPDYIADAVDLVCTNDMCTGLLFQDKQLASGAQKCLPYKTYPYASITAWLSRMLSRDGHPELMQAWCKPEDTQLGTPIT